jgi:hypothetical protein
MTATVTISTISDTATGGCPTGIEQMLALITTLLSDITTPVDVDPEISRITRWVD